jgi:hypothetical protein
MPTFPPPDDPDKPDTPPVSFDRAFVQEIVRSIVAATRRDDPCEPDETRPGMSASRETREAPPSFDRPPRTAIEQAEVLHAAILDSLVRAMDPRMPIDSVLQLRNGAARMQREFAKLAHEIKRPPGEARSC